MLRELKELKQAERDRRAAWSRQYPGGVHLITFTMNDHSRGCLTTAQQLDYPLVAKVSGSELYIYAVK